MKKPLLLAACSVLILCHTDLFAQNKTLGVGVATPNPNAALHVESPTGNQGFILPRLASAQRLAPAFINALSTTDHGLMVYDTDLNTIFIWDGTAWKNTGEVAGGVKLTFPYYDSVTTATGTNDLFSLKYNNAEPKRIMRIENQNPANGSSALSVASAGSGLTAYFQSSNPDNTSSTLYATTNSDSAGALAPVAVYGESTGTGSLGGSFRVNNAANNHPALFAETIGTGSSIMGVTATGFSAVIGEATGGWSNGVSGISTSADPGSFAMLGQNHGGGPAGVFNISSSTNSSASLEGSTSGLGTAGVFRIKNPASKANVIEATTSGSGAAINAENTGTADGFAGNFRVTSTTNNYPAIQASSAGTASGVRVIQDLGTGPGMDVIMKNQGSSASGISIDQLANGNGATFTINNAANSAAGVSSSTNGLGSAGLFEQTNTSASSAALVAKSNGVAFALITGGIQVTTFNVIAPSITTRAMAYHVTAGGTVFTFDFLPTPSGDGELYMVYNDTGAMINVEGIQINNGEGKTIINFGGTFRGF